MQLDFDKWEGNRNKGGSISIEANNTDKVLEHLRMLDQRTYTQLIIGSDRSNLTVGGGSDRYVCTMTLGDHEQYYNLIDESGPDSENEIDVVTGGQAGSFPQRIVVNYETALSAVTYYVANQTMNPNLTWEED